MLRRHTHREVEEERERESGGISKNLFKHWERMCETERNWEILSREEHWEICRHTSSELSMRRAYHLSVSLSLSHSTNLSCSFSLQNKTSTYLLHPRRMRLVSVEREKYGPARRRFYTLLLLLSHRIMAIMNRRSRGWKRESIKDDVVPNEWTNE